MVINKEDLRFRKEKLKEIKNKIKIGTATEEEISFIKFWKGVFGENAY